MLNPSAGLPETYPWVGQDRAEECGVAALVMVARYHGLPVAADDLRPHFVFDARGVSVSDLSRVAERIGLRANAVRVCPSFLDVMALPAVAHLTTGHYVVVFARGPGTLTIGDPARGVVTVPDSDFLRSWGGIVVLIRRRSAAPLARN
jgi:ABC-type bacteriocin/lantibiotic exporter with double-glycine peptidase domain